MEVNKPVEGETVICMLCHKDGHKSYQCKVKTGDKQKQKLTSKISNTFINKVDKRVVTPYLIKKNVGTCSLLGKLIQRGSGKSASKV
jgi:hypothetical protein